MSEALCDPQFQILGKILLQGLSTMVLCGFLGVHLILMLSESCFVIQLGKKRKQTNKKSQANKQQNPTLNVFLFQVLTTFSSPKCN